MPNADLCPCGLPYGDHRVTLTSRGSAAWTLRMSPRCWSTSPYRDFYTAAAKFMDLVGRSGMIGLIPGRANRERLYRWQPGRGAQPGYWDWSGIDLAPPAAAAADRTVYRGVEIRPAAALEAGQALVVGADGTSVVPVTNLAEEQALTREAIERAFAVIQAQPPTPNPHPIWGPSPLEGLIAARLDYRRIGRTLDAPAVPPGHDEPDQ